MSIELILRPEAEQEIEAAFRWYQRRSPGRGIYFLQAVRVALDTIQSNPETYPKVYRNARRVLLHGFPYAVIYVVTGAAIEVAAVVHTRRHPRRWRSRI